MALTSCRLHARSVCVERLGIKVYYHTDLCGLPGLNMFTTVTVVNLSKIWAALRIQVP